VLQALGLDTPRVVACSPAAASSGTKRSKRITSRSSKLAGIESCVMTNDPLDPAEAAVWNQASADPCFHAALRLDRILNDWRITME